MKNLFGAFLVVLAGTSVLPSKLAAQSDALTSAYQQCNTLSEQSRYGEAENFCLKALKLGKTEFGSEHTNTAVLLNALAILYAEVGRYGEAGPLYRRVLAIRKKALGPNHPHVANTLINTANLYSNQGRYDDAEPLYKRALAIRERNLGSSHPDVALGLNNIAILYMLQSRYGDAEHLYKRALAIREKAFGPDHPDVADSLAGLGALYMAQGQHKDSETLYKRALAIREKAFGLDHRNVAGTLHNLAILYSQQGRYTDSEPLRKRSLAIWEKVLGPDHPHVAASLNGLAALSHTWGRYGDAEPLYKRALAIWEKALGSDHPNVASGLINIASLYMAQGRYGDAEPLHKRALAIREKALGSTHPDVAQSHNGLGRLYVDQGRYDDAEPLYKRALAIREKALGPDHPDIAESLNNLANLYADLGRDGDGEPLYKRALAIREKAFGPNHPDVADSLTGLGGLYFDLDRYADAEPLFKRAVTIREKALGPDHPNFAFSLSNIAMLFKSQRRYVDATPLLKRAHAILEKAQGSTHPDVAFNLYIQAGLFEAQGLYSQALDSIRRAGSIHRDRAARGGKQRSGGGLSGQKKIGYVFSQHARYAWAVANAEPSRRALLVAEAFEAGQLALATSAAAAVAGMSARFAAGDDALARVVRAQQDAAQQWQHTDKKLIDAVSQPPDKRNGEIESQLRTQLASLDRTLTDLDDRLSLQFPEYAEMAIPRPVTLAEVRKLLNPQEALLSYLVTDEETLLWVVRRDGVRMLRIDFEREPLEAAVRDLRTGLDLNLSELPPFNTIQAFELYSRIFAPAEPLLRGIHHLFVVPDGPLQSLPLGVLVAEKPHRVFADYGGVPWLAKKYAMTTLPAVSSLKALKTFTKVAQASRPFIGFGDPVLDGAPGFTRGILNKKLFKPQGGADIQAVRSLGSLPGTARELTAMARALRGGGDSLYLRGRATEQAVKTIDLSDIRVIAFATHGLVAGELGGLAEPALVLTPPKRATEENDGLLTASEVAKLKLNADLVILSACNTAGSDGSPNADALSGLAKAFFYAGSRALLVSHWPVDTDATIKLTTGMLAQIGSQRGIGRAEALRRSMMALMRAANSHYAHPAYWAPFVVVGEGGSVPHPAALPQPEVPWSAPAAIFVTKKNTNVRRSPSTAAAKVMTLPKGTHVQVLEEIKGARWYRVGRDGEALGFVFGALVEPASD